MDTQIQEISQRIKGLREILEIPAEEMASYLETTTEDYIAHENGECDFSFTFLQKCANRFGIDIVELLTGENPHLSFFTVTKKDHGVNMERRTGFSYQHLAHNLKDKLGEPFLVKAPYSVAEQSHPIALSTHKGQEFDYILKGSLKVQMEQHTLVLNEGDSIMYDSGHEHGMIATGGKDCLFLALVIKK